MTTSEQPAGRSQDVPVIPVTPEVHADIAPLSRSNAAESSRWESAKVGQERDSLRAKLDELADAVAMVPSKAYVDTVRAIFTADYTDALGKVTVPTLVLIGDQDDATPMAESEFMVERIAGAVLETIPGAGHLSNIDQPEAFNRHLAEFHQAPATSKRQDRRV